jgi:hypothetical protein
MSETPDTAADKGLKPWEKPVVTQVDLTEDELGKLRVSEDPMALLLKMKPELGSKDRPDQ